MIEALKDVNAELLMQAVEYAEKEPRRFNMGVWHHNLSGLLHGNSTVYHENYSCGFPSLLRDKNDAPPCGVVGCLAGIVCIISGKAQLAYTDDEGVRWYDEPLNGWQLAAQKELGLTNEQAERLFIPYKGFAGDKYDGHWCEPFGSQYEKVKNDPVERVKVLRARCEHFLATGE